ncbi:DUF262 domain-containing protein [Brevundimonas sp. DWR2-3-1b1]|uniref:DUF262 domain-containing protein n=1 Tax=Brevundimonas sp. DWR2-3-1b1 TaxID=2804641 RepID=UPI003CFB6679
MATSLTAHERRISQIFSNEYSFSIPGYQRPYAWGREQAQDLLDDLIGFMRGRTEPVLDMPPYFLGSIVLIKPDASPDADVVDGQQRLTTLTLLLSAIRASVSAKDAADLTHLIYQEGAPILGTQDHFRLLLRPQDREFFQNYVQRAGGFAKLLTLEHQLSDSQRRLRDNGRLFTDRIVTMSEEDRARLAQFIVTRCFLVVVSTPDLDSAYRIFSVMNSRGLDLSATDILKAEIIGAIPSEYRDTYTGKWETAEEDLGREAFVDLFSHVRMIYRKTKPQGTLLKEFQAHVSADRDPRKLIDEIILPAARAYEELVDESYVSSQFAEEVNRHLKWLNRLEYSDWMPPALAYSVAHRGEPEAMRDFFADLERLAYAVTITRMGVNDRIERFSLLTGEIEAGADLTAQTSALQLTPAEKVEFYDRLGGPVYDTLPARVRSTLLLRLDDLMSGGGATYDYPTVTVEHVLPQNPGAESAWTVWFPEPEARANWVHRLGNLALLTRKKNSGASNYEFDRKKDAYFANGGVSPFSLTTQVLGHETWTPSIVAARQLALVGRLADHWRLQ